VYISRLLLLVGPSRFVLYGLYQGKAITKPGHGWQIVKVILVH